jgi:hypothetical protein
MNEKDHMPSFINLVVQSRNKQRNTINEATILRGHAFESASWGYFYDGFL